ncbi:MAG TPA: type II toxin-antitoxin system prevent-host-death family antitoxin [Candidatus Baltobacteraceae bacterium]|jgi:prevent-host-death family protein
MKQVNLYEAKTQLSRLIQEAVLGEEIVIAKNGEPQVKLVPLRKRRRSDGAGMGAKFLTGPIDWEQLDEPLEELAEYTL